MHELRASGKGFRKTDEVGAALLLYETAHHHNDREHRFDRRFCRLGEAVQDDAITDVAQLVATAYPDPREHLFVLAALKQDEVGPAAAPLLEEPPGDVREPVVVREVEGSMDRVKGLAPREARCGQSEERRLRGMCLYEVEPAPAEQPPKLGEGLQVR